MAKYKKRADGRYATTVTYLGKKHYFTAKNSAALDRKVQEFKIAKRSGTYSSSMLFRVFAQNWLADIKTTVADSTYVKYERNVRLYLNPYIGDMPLCNIQPGDVRSAFTKVCEQIASSTASRAFVTAKSIFQQAVDDDMLAKNPMRTLKSPKRENVKPWVALEEEQIKKLMDTITDAEHRLIFKLDAVTGLRRGELMGLRVQDVNFDRHTIAIRQTVKYVNRKVYISQYPKTSRSRRTVTVATEILPEIKAWIRDCRLKAMRDELWQDNGLLFPAEHGLPRNPDYATRLGRKYRKLAALPENFCLHSLRHTSATQLLLHGINYKVVQERLGHSSPVVTLKTYAHVMPGQDEEAAETLANII